MKQRIWQLGMTAVAALALNACGGGGSESQSGATQAAQPNATALAARSDTREPADPSAAKAAGNGAYIVRLADEPVVAYKGGVAGHAATKPNKGQKIDPNAPSVVKYMGYLAARQDAALASVGGGKKLHNYGYAFNGFAATLTDAQAQKLALTAGVLSVAKDEARPMDTATTPAFLGLSGPTGFWATKATGENVIIGVIDSGVWPEHPSFSDRSGTNGNATKDGKLAYQQIPGWHGKCVPGEQFNASDCNQKLIGARYYNAGFGGNAGIDATLPHEFNSPRDHNGHGTHTASTAGGNANVTITGEAARFGAINGIAPRARIAAYKVCWSVPGTAGSCYGSDTIAAVDQAIADGVDVLNYSVSGSQTNFRDPVEIAFLYAADAGVFVATSAGNSGPNASTVAHPGPWVTTVAAGTHDRNLVGSVTLGNGVTYSGASLATPVGPAAFIDAARAALPGADAAKVLLCYAAVDNGGAAVLDPAKIAGKIVLCDRGGNARINKSLAVKEAGGIGMVLVNTSAGTLEADIHAVPTVHLANTDRPAVKAYAAGASPTATINGSVIDRSAAAPFTAAFSSRGPLQASGSLLKPDLIAPGQSILAGVAPPGNAGKLFDFYSGTSMSSPHVAGLAALMKELKPGWSPMAIKSALMTTGYDVLDVNANGSPISDATRIFRQGAGHVAPMKTADPGLVFDSGFNDWIGFLCGTQLPVASCTAAGIPVIEPSNLNGASIAVGALAGTQTITRTVTNVGSATETYTPSVAGLTGVTVAMLPATLTVPKNGKASFTLTFTRTTAALNAYTGGQFTLIGTDPNHRVRLPVVVRPVALSAPAEVGASYGLTFGYTGAFTATPRGMVPAATSTGSIVTDATLDFQVTVPAGTTYARFSLFDSDISQPSDLDLEVYGPTGAPVGGSGGGTSAEEVNLLNPAPGVYTVRVVGYAIPVGTANFTLFNWTLGAAAAAPANMVVSAPASAVQGPATIGLSFSNLTSGTRYLGSVAYAGVAGLPNPTIVRVNAP